MKRYLVKLMKLFPTWILSYMVLVYIVIFTFSSCNPKRNSLEHTKQSIEKMLQSQTGIYAVAFLDLTDTSNCILLNEKELFHAASTMKTPVLYELYKQRSMGKLKLSDSVRVVNSFRSIVDSSVFQMDISDDSEDELYQKIGDNISLFELAHPMITRSSNLATNILIKVVGATNVTRSMRELGAKDIQVLRGVEDIKAYEAGLSNRTTALDLMILFEKLGKFELVDSISSKAMIDILLEQEFNELIPALLPSEVKTAHKTGSITKVLHDSGLVILPDGRSYVLVILSRDWEDKSEATILIQQLSKMIYEFFKGS